MIHSFFLESGDLTPERPRTWLLKTISIWLFLSGVSYAALPDQKVDLVKIQKEEARRRKTTGPARISVSDANLKAIRIEGSTGYCSQIITTAPLPKAPAKSYVASRQRSGPKISISRFSFKNKVRIIQDEIENAEANIAFFEKKLRSIDQDHNFYPFADREDFKRESHEKLLRLIDGERYFIYLTKQKLH